MAHPRKKPSAEDLAPLRKRIEVWRSTQFSRGQTPDEIWDSAVALARIYGVCQVARAVDLDYKALRTRVTRALEKPGLVEGAFVELPVTLAGERDHRCWNFLICCPLWSTGAFEGSHLSGYMPFPDVVPRTTQDLHEG